MLPWSADLAGRIDEHTIASELLRGNPLGDPYERPLWVYLPPGYDDDPDRRYPSVYVIQGYTGHVAMWRNRTPFRQPFTETADAVFAQRRGAARDRGLRRRLDFLRRQPVRRLPWHRPLPLLPVRGGRALGRRRYRTLAGRGAPRDHGEVQRRVRRDDHPDAAARPVRRAGHARRRLALRALLPPGFREAARHLRGTTTATSGGWWDDFRSRTPFTKAADQDLLVLLGVAACFSANKDGTSTCRSTRRPAALRPEVWQRWLDWDPVRMAPRYAGALRSLRAIWIDAGTRDEYYLDLGAEAFRQALRERRRPDEVIHFELFDATHWASTTGTRCRWPGSASASRTDPPGWLPHQHQARPDFLLRPHHRDFFGARVLKDR